MPASYQGFITSLRRRRGLTLADVITLLLQEEIIHKAAGSADQLTALAITDAPPPSFKKKIAGKGKPKWKKPFHSPVSSSSQPGFSSQFSGDRSDTNHPPVTCFYCHKEGHHIRDCRKHLARENK